MPEYHGDIMYKVGKTHRPKDPRRLVIGLVLLLTFGMTGIHQFYLGNHRTGYAHLVLCMLMMFAAISFSGTLLLALLGVQLLALAGEAILMVIEEA